MFIPGDCNTLGQQSNMDCCFYISGQKMPQFPLMDHSPTKLTRNEEIREHYAQGETIVDLAEAYEISEQRVLQVLRRRRN
jgi:Mor family transcriptional regulator